MSRKPRRVTQMVSIGNEGMLTSSTRNAARFLVEPWSLDPEYKDHSSPFLPSRVKGMYWRWRMRAW